MHARTSFDDRSLQKDRSQVIHVDLSQVTQKSELPVLSLTGSIVEATKQPPPCTKPVEVEAAAPTGLPWLCLEQEVYSTGWFGGWL